MHENESITIKVGALKPFIHPHCQKDIPWKGIKSPSELYPTFVYSIITATSHFAHPLLWPPEIPE